jgi:peptidyl-dipeptidase Dcp
MQQRMTTRLALALAIALGTSMPAYAQSGTPASTGQSANPFFSESPLPLHYPQFDKIVDADFAPAFDAGMAAQLKEIDAIADNPAKPTFDNTIVAMEKSGQVLDRATTTFFNLVGTDTNPVREQLRSDYSGKFAAHRDAISLNGRLFARIQALYDTRTKLGLDAQGVRLVEKYHTDFVRDGARLSDADKAKLKDMNAETAALGTQFSQNVLKEVNESAVVVDDVKQLAGLSPSEISSASCPASTSSPCSTPPASRR